MKIIIKMLCLTLSLCAISLHASEEFGEHKGSKSPRSSHLSRSVSTVHSECLSKNRASYSFDAEAVKQVPEDQLTGEERAYLKANAPKVAPVVCGVDPFELEPFTGKKNVRAPYAPTFLQKIARLCCCCCK